MMLLRRQAGRQAGRQNGEVPELLWNPDSDAHELAVEGTHSNLVNRRDFFSIVSPQLECAKRMLA